MYEGKGIYRHYKGGLYEVLGIGLEEATLAIVVIYSPIDEPTDFMKGFGATMWTRPIEDFSADVPDVGASGFSASPVTTPRFIKLSMTEIMKTRNERLLEWARFQIDHQDQ